MIGGIRRQFCFLLLGLWKVWLKDSNIIFKDENWRQAVRALVTRPGHVRLNKEAADSLAQVPLDV